MKKIVICLVVLTITTVGLALWFFVGKDQGQRTLSNPQEKAVQQNNQTTPRDFNKSQYSLTDPASKWVIVNKKNPIPTTYVPDLTVPDVRLRLSANEEQMKISKQVAPAIKEMFDAAKNDGITLVFGSGYRSANKQREFYQSYKARDGQAAADTYSARPGHSEHQTGLAVDLTSPSGSCHLEECWKDTQEGKWAAENAHNYGFIMRYKPGKQSITGYQYEPWHFRYVGKELAAELHKTGQTMEEFFDYPPAENYD